MMAWLTQPMIFKRDALITGASAVSCSQASFDERTAVSIVRYDDRESRAHDTDVSIWAISILRLLNKSCGSLALLTQVNARIRIAVMKLIFWRIS